MSYSKKILKKNTIRNFMVSQQELDAIEILKANSINISDFLRYSLRTFSQELQKRKNDK